MSKRPLRIIFMGTPDFAAATLKALIDGPDEIVAVVTQPDRAKGRGKKLTPPPTKVLAEAVGIPVLQPTKIKTENFRNGLLTYQPDLIVVTAYGRILPKSLLDLSPLGCINVHGSLLPKYRGAAPIQWAVINGEKETGVTIIQMDAGMDTGDMLLSAKITTAPDETAGSLFDKLAVLGSATLLTAIKGLQEGTIIPVPQDHDLATVAPMLKKDDGLIDWHKDAKEIECLIRGLDPWPTAFCFLDGKRLRLFRPEVLHQDSDAPPGTVLQADKRGILVACGKNTLLTKEIQPEGKKRMTVESFLCGHPIAHGNTSRPVSSPATNQIAYLDCFSGVSGDMLLGALLHAGLNRQLLIEELAKLQLDGLELLIEEKSVNAISSIKVTISSDRRQELRTLPAILHILEKSSLAPTIIDQAAKVFQALARAEAKVHANPGRPGALS